MKIKVSEAEREVLDWMVAKCEGTEHLFDGHEVGRLHYSTDWAQAGPIIEREGMSIGMVSEYWQAHLSEFHLWMDGSTPLIAAMRCYVASKLGEEVDVPDELTNVRSEE